MAISWSERRNLETSLVEFLQEQAALSGGATVFYKGKQKTLDIRVGFAPQQNWNLPNISVYYDSRTSPRSFVGQNKRINTHLMIIDVRALDDGMRNDIADWVGDTINDGFNFYTYSPNSSDPSSPNKTLTGKVSVDFVSDTPIRPGEDVDLFDKYRHNISINAQIQE